EYAAVAESRDHDALVADHVDTLTYEEGHPVRGCPSC
ncbi:MAG: hypothetical protein QOD59_336, partial [Mycobacterium sp.]|nr:hypothetical protein [Mycobacterium sp.]